MMDYSYRLNSQLPIKTRRDLDLHHFNANKFVKILMEQRRTTGRTNLTYIWKHYHLHRRSINIMLDCWHIHSYTLPSMKAKDWSQQQIDNFHKQDLREMGFTRKNYLRLRNATDLSDFQCLKRFGIPHRQSKYFHLFNLKLLDSRDRYRRSFLKGHKTKAERYTQEEIAERRRQTCIKKFGVPEPFMASEVKEKIAQTNLSRYGAANVFNLPQVQQRIRDKSSSFYSNYNLFDLIRRGGSEQISVGESFVRHINYRLFHVKQNVRHALLLFKFCYFKNHGHRFGIDYVCTVFPQYRYYYVLNFFLEHQEELFKYVNRNTSNLENKFAQMLFDNGYSFKMHCHLLPMPFRNYHFDYYLPQYKLVIELNPTFTHDNKGVRMRIGSRNWKYHQARLHGYTLLNLYERDLLNGFNLAKLKLKDAISNLKQGKVLMCDDVPYCEWCTHDDKRRGIRCWNEGYTWWK